MVVVGLTGSYGMGKSSVLAEFRRLGAATIDSDGIVAGLLKRPAVVAKIRALLGADVVDSAGRLLKRKVAAMVFSSPHLRKGLEAMIHPLVMKEVEAFVRKKRRRGVIVVEVPLLFEGGYEKRFDRTVTVYTTRRTAIARLKAAGVLEDDARARLRAQLSITEKRRLADYCISNEGTPQQLRRRVSRVFHDLIREGLSRP